MMIYAMRFTACYRGEDGRKMLKELRASFINMSELSRALLYLSLSWLLRRNKSIPYRWFMFAHSANFLAPLSNSHPQALRTRAKKQRAARKHNISDLTAGGSIIENIAQTKRLAETTMDGSSNKSSKIVPEEERPTNTGSGSNDEDDENAGWVATSLLTTQMHANSAVIQEAIQQRLKISIIVSKLHDNSGLHNCN